jgi:hypothetical protein
MSNKFDCRDELKQNVQKWFMSACQLTSMNRAYKTLCPIMTGASVWLVIMSKSRISYVKFDNNE